MILDPLWRIGKLHNVNKYGGNETASLFIVTDKTESTHTISAFQGQPIYSKGSQQKEAMQEEDKMGSLLHLQVT